MEKVSGKSTDSIRLTLTVALCLMSFVAGAAYTKADLWMTMRNTPVIKTPVITQPPPDDGKAITASERSAPIEQASLASPLALNENVGARDSQPGQEPADKWHTVRMRVTAYCPCPRCCGQYADGMTACGHVIQPGDTFVAADKRYPFGTTMIVPGYDNGRPVKVLDRGGAIRGDRVDVFFPSHEEALEWGVKYVEVKVHGK